MPETPADDGRRLRRRITMRQLTGKILIKVNLVLGQRRDLVECRMYRRQMIGLEIIFDRKFPVGLHFEAD